MSQTMILYTRPTSPSVCQSPSPSISTRNDSLSMFDGADGCLSPAPPPCTPPLVITAREHSSERFSDYSLLQRRIQTGPNDVRRPSPDISHWEPSPPPSPSRPVDASLDSPVPPTNIVKIPEFCSTSGTPTLRSDRFWYADGTVIVKVEDTLYKLYKGFLAQKSTFFSSDKITVELKSPPLWSPHPRPLNRTGEALEPIRLYGSPELVGIGSESDPVELSVAKADFELLLSYLFRENSGSKSKLSVEDWAAIASAAQKLEFNSTRAAAEAKVLKTYDAFKLVDIGQNRANHSYLLEGVRILYFRDSALTREEGRRLGIDLTVIIGDVREQSAKGSCWTNIKPQVVRELEELIGVKKEE